MDQLQQAYLVRAKTALDLATSGQKHSVPGRAFLREMITRAIVRGSEESMAAYTTQRWPATGAAIAKGAVPALSTGQLGGNGTAAEFFSLPAERSLLGKINCRRVQSNARFSSMVAGARGSYVGQGKPTPISWQALNGSTLQSLKVQAIVAATRESVQAVGETGEATLQSDLIRAISLALDEAFIDPVNSGIVDEMPASIASGQLQIPSVGTDASAVRLDITNLIAAFAGDFESAVIIMHPLTAVQIALLQKPLGESTLGVLGGQLFGLPVVTSNGVPLDSSGGSITLLDPTSIAVAFDGFNMDVAEHATLEMDDVPTNEGGTETTLVSLWQTNTVAWKSTVYANWEVQGAGRVVSITGVNYAAGG